MEDKVSRMHFLLDLLSSEPGEKFVLPASQSTLHICQLAYVHGRWLSLALTLGLFS